MFPFFRIMDMLPRDLKIQIQRKRIKNIYIRIGRDGAVKVTAPWYSQETEIEDFVLKKEAWIRQCIARIPQIPIYHYQSGEIHDYAGRKMTLLIHQGTKNGGWIDHDHHIIHVALHSSHGNAKKIYETLMREELYKYIQYFVEKWVPCMHVCPGHITIRKMKSRWGSCQVRTGDLCFALDLMTKPEPCIEAVVVHELNHLLERGHTPRFHALMAHWIEDYKKRDALLNEWPKEFV